ncbi:MAG TPA: hypothetical protein ENJ59_01190 [Thermofilum sp.]|nr:hypothetical protein [Thermofilum sp.]
MIKIACWYYSKNVAKDYSAVQKDKDALEAAINAFYTGWKIDIYTLKGARTLEKIEENLFRYYNDNESYFAIAWKRRRRSL